MSCCASARLWNEENAQRNKRCCVSVLKGGGSPPLGPADAHSSSLSVGTVNATLLLLPAAPLSIDSEHVSREEPGVSARNLPAGPFWILRERLVVITLALRSLVDSPRLKALSAPSRFLPLPLSFFRSALSLRRGFCRSREDLCVGEVWVCWSKRCSEMM